MTPIPMVKPTITGPGINLITEPSFSNPIATSKKPAIKVAICKPAIPY